MNIREVKEDDLNKLLELYIQLNSQFILEDSNKLKSVWSEIINNKNYHIIVIEKDEKIISSCTVIIIPNLTHNERSYALVENVVTDKQYRKEGFATACLNYAKKIAEKENCYKIMLLTGSKKESTLKFYREAGYNSKDKTAFIQWL